MPSHKRGSPEGMEDNLKRATTEMLVLTLLAREDMYAPQVTQSLKSCSGGALDIVFPYAALYRLIDDGFVTEAYKKIAPDGRRRQYYQITEAGRAYLHSITAVYRRFTTGVLTLLDDPQ